MNNFISLGKIGRTVNPSKAKPKKIVGKYQIKLVDPKTIGDEKIKPSIAFLESVKNIKPTNKMDIVNNNIFFREVLFGVINSAKQKGQTNTIHKPA